MLKRRVSSTPRQKQKLNFRIGSLGEIRAQQWLAQQGLLLLDHNLMVWGSEIDILAFHSQRLILQLFEVKTRSNLDTIHPTHAVSWKKRWKMHLAGEWLREHWQQYLQWRVTKPPTWSVRVFTSPSPVFPKSAQFAIISVVGNQIESHTLEW